MNALNQETTGELRKSRSLREQPTKNSEERNAPIAAVENQSITAEHSALRGFT